MTGFQYLDEKKLVLSWRGQFWPTFPDGERLLVHLIFFRGGASSKCLVQRHHLITRMILMMMMMIMMVMMICYDEMSVY